jgi:flagellar biosynthesis protein FlhF
MISKIYQASTMADALAEVKRDLGRNAVILHTRRMRKGGLWGIGGRLMWEVTASPNMGLASRIATGQYVPNRPGEGGEAHGTKASVEVGPTPERVPVTQEGGPGTRVAGLREVTQTSAMPRMGAADEGAAAHADARTADLAEQVVEIRKMVESLLGRRGGEADGAAGAKASLAGELELLKARLIEQDILADTAEEIANEIAVGLTGQQVSDPAAVRAELRKCLAGRIRTHRDNGNLAAGERGRRARVIAFIGPTGVGKTTTIAKLAAHHKLRHNRSVGLITMDTYRIAAVDQLRTYAEIIEVPIRAVLTSGELQQAVHAMRDLDVVLIDTAGRSQNNRLHLNQLRSFLTAGETDEVNLVISATSNRRCTREVLERFVPVGANRLIVTKLDEAGAFGVFVNACQAGGGPICYVTTGQDVPDDIAPADSDSLAECIVRGVCDGREE